MTNLSMANDFINAPKELQEFLQKAEFYDFVYEIDGDVLKLARAEYDGDLNTYSPYQTININIDELLNNDLSNTYVDCTNLDKLTLNDMDNIMDMILSIKEYLL